jgi:hypothetical protein
MTQYLISFGARAMDHVPGEDAPAVARAARAAVQEAVNAGVYVSAGGLEDQSASIVATGGAVTDGPCPQAIGGSRCCPAGSPGDCAGRVSGGWRVRRRGRSTGRAAWQPRRC